MALTKELKTKLNAMKKLTEVNMRQNALYLELEDYWNVTRARRIRINIELDRLANEERQLLGNTEEL